MATGRYVRGTAYLRRELEMPAAALHHAGTLGCPPLLLCCRRSLWFHRLLHQLLHRPKCIPRPITLPRCPTLDALRLPSTPPTPPALYPKSSPPVWPGIQAVKLEDLERRLRADMLAEAVNWGGKVLLHREVASQAGPTPVRMRRIGGSATPTSSSRAAGSGAATPAATAGADSAGTAGTAATADASEAAQAQAAAAAVEAGEDITRTTQYQPTMQVQAFWETTGDVGDIDQVCGWSLV